MNANPYYERVNGQDLDTLKEDPDFQTDLIRFFNGGRYNMTPQEIEEMGVDGLYDKYLDHMRYQEVNEATALQDLWYVKDGKQQPREDIESFGRLISAWDNSGSAGDGFGSKVWDYGAATVTSPSFAAGLIAGGVGGPLSKFGTFAANKATQMTLRQALTKYAAKEIAGTTLKRAAVQGALRGAAAEGALAVGQESALAEIRNESIDGYKVDPVNFALSVGIQATVGGIAGGISRSVTVGEQKKALELIQQHHKQWEAAEKLAQAKTKAVLAQTQGTQESQKAIDQITALVSLKELTQKGSKLNPLDPERVLEGQKIKNDILSGSGVRAGLAMSDLRKMAAASIDMGTKLDIQPGERISTAMARANDQGLLGDVWASTKAQYNLTNSQMSDIFLADVSEAAKIMNFQSQAKRGYLKESLKEFDEDILKAGDELAEDVRKQLEDFLSKLGAVDPANRKEAAKNIRKQVTALLKATDLSPSAKRKGQRKITKTIDELLRPATTSKEAAEFTQSIEDQIKGLAAQGIPTPGEDEIARLAKAADSTNSTNWLQEIDSMRISFLTSQPATTVANAISQTVRLGVDASDQVFKNIYTSIATRQAINPVRGALSAIRNTGISPPNAKALKLLLDEQSPELARKIYFDASRVENATGGQSRMAKLSRVINIGNSAVDSVFKQGIFYASLDRQLMTLNNPKLGRSAVEFLKNGSSLDDLPEGLLKRIETDTLSFVYQKGFKGEKTNFGKLSNTVIQAHRDLPFTVSTVIPFPRYIANQLEFIHDYTPLVGLIGMGLDGLQRASGKGARTASKDMGDRVARQATGVLAMMSAYYIRSTQEGKTDPLSITGPDGSDMSIERPGGPHNTHLIIMDAVYRQLNGLPPPEMNDTIFAALEAASGLSIEGYGGNVPVEAIKSITEGKFTEGFNRFVGDLASTFTFPLAIVNDLHGQIYPERADKPYTRDVFGEDVNLFNLMQADAEMTARATRFIPDTEMIQYTQSFDGKTDIPLFNPFNDKGPVRTLSPLLKQISSMERKPALSSLQKEMRRLNMKEWDVYGSRKVENAAVDEIVRRRLSETLSQEYLAWRNGPLYSEVTNPKQQQALLRTWLLDRVNETQQSVEEGYMKLAAENPRLASGFVRNQFQIKEADAQMNFDEVVQIYTRGEFETVDQYLYQEGPDGDGAVRQEIVRRMEIMNWSAREESVLGGN